MHTLESTIVITTIILCIFGCIFMEREIFERILVYRELCEKAEVKTRSMKEPYCEGKTGYMTAIEEAKDIYHPIRTLVGGNSKILSSSKNLKNPFKLLLSKERDGMFSADKTSYEERVLARNFDPLEIIRMTDQGIELMLELKRR